MEIKDNLLYVDGKQVQFRKSPNVGGKIKSHKYLIIHYTGTSSASSAINWMLNPDADVSAHLHLDKEGAFVQLVDFDTVAWHVGKSEWLGLTALNSYTLGVEICNNGSEPYTEKQIKSLTEAAIALHEQFNFEDILGHEQVAMPRGRKQDPGRFFPMAKFKADVLGSASVPIKKTTTDVNLRKGAGTNFEAIQVIKSGTEVNVLSEKDSWSEVFICDLKLKGWIKSSYLK